MFADAETSCWILPFFGGVYLLQLSGLPFPAPGQPLGASESWESSQGIKLKFAVFCGLVIQSEF